MTTRISYLTFLLTILVAGLAWGSDSTKGESQIIGYLHKQLEEVHSTLTSCDQSTGLINCLEAELPNSVYFTIKKEDSLVYWSDAIMGFPSWIINSQSGHEMNLIDIQDEQLLSITHLDSIYQFQFYLPVYFHDAEKQAQFEQLIKRSNPFDGSYCFSFDERTIQIDSLSDLSSLINIDQHAITGQKSKTRAWVWLTLFNGLILLIFLFSGKSIELMGRFWGTMATVATALTIRILAVQPIFTSDLRQLAFFSDAHFDRYFSSSLGDLLLNTILFLAISLFLIGNLYRSESIKSSLLKRMSLTVANYASILFGILILSFLIRNLLLEAKIPLQLDRIFSFNWGSVLVVGSMVCFVNGLFFLNHLLTHNIAKRGISKSSRLGALFIGGLITLPVLLFLDLNISPFSFFILSFAYIFLLDVFTDSKNISISWLVIWLLLLSGGTSLLLYNYHREATELKKKQFAMEIGSAFHKDENSIKSSASFNNYLKEGFTYGVYKERKLISGDINVYPAVHTLKQQIDPGEFKYAQLTNQDILVYGTDEQTIIAVGKHASRFINSISLFSFVFCVFVLVAFILLFLNTRYSFLPDHWRFKIGNKPSLRKRIQIVLFGLLMLTFIAICFFTIYFFRDNENRNQYDSTTAALTRTLSYLNKDIVQLESVSQGYLQSDDQLRNIELLTGAEILLFDRNGEQVEYSVIQNDNSPQRLPYDLYRELIQPINNQSIYKSELNFKGQSFIVAKAGFTPDQKSFVAVQQNTFKGGGASSLNDFLGTLLNMYIFLLIVTGSIALAFADSITRPLSSLSKKFREFKLGRRNETINWDGSDELGELISDYNRMITELDDSAKLLAMTERELAWREMARQVAHEIKNPLTPMKLSIQHLQYAIKRDKGHALFSLVDRVSQTLVEQIDNLANIASEFSNFAKLPKPENEKVVLNDVVSSAHDLFRKREDMDISLYVPIDEIYVFADRHHLIRVLNNLLKNAIQAIPSDRRGKIEIKVFKEKDYAIIEVSDNGIGIKDSFKEKVFKPNFTSKNSGSGLGLAICSNIVETFNGKIYFETQEGVGTDFFVKIPLMHMQDNFKKEERVAL